MAVEDTLAPDSPDILKQIAAAISGIQTTGQLPSQETQQLLGDKLRQHMSYVANKSLLDKLTKSYAENYTGTKNV